MPGGLLRWLGRNLSMLLMAFVLAVVVWVSAILAVDPNEERQFPRAVNLEVLGRNPGLLQVARLPTQVRVTLNAPRSVWDQLTVNPDRVRAWVDLSGTAEGQHRLEVHVQVDANPARIVKVEPGEVDVVLEPQVTKEMPVELIVTGEPALGYRRSSPVLEPAAVMVSGPKSALDKVARLTATVDISGANDTVRRTLTITPVDDQEQPLSDVTLSPAVVTFNMNVNLLGGYRNVVVKVVTSGEVLEGYWLTNISVSPPNVTVFSANPRQVNELPGFVETNPIDLAGLRDDTDIRATLKLPEGVTLVGDESVLVRLSIAAREGSLLISLPIELVGLLPELDGTASPETIEVLLAGPLPILNNLNPASIRLVVNVSGLEPGSYELQPVIDLLPNQVSVVYILPETVTVEVVIVPTPTPPAPGAVLPSPVVTITPAP